MTTTMTMHSARPSPSSKKDMTSENTAAMMRMMTMTSVSCSQIILHTLFCCFCRRSFLPYSERRFAASSSLRPSSDVCSASYVCSTLSACHGLGVSLLLSMMG